MSVFVNNSARHFSVVVCNGSRRLKYELQLPFRGVDAASEYFPHGRYASFTHGLFYYFNIDKGILTLVGVQCVQYRSKDRHKSGVLAEPMWDRPLFFGDLPFGGYGGGYRGVVASAGGFGFGYFDRCVRFILRLIACKERIDE